jgi:flagellar basal body-associated protein FliL
MADEEKENQDEKGATPAPASKFSGLLGNKKVLIGLAVGVVVIIALVVGGMLFSMKKNAAQEAEAKAAASAEVAAAEASDPSKAQPEWYGADLDLEEDEEPLGALFPFDTFVVNLKDQHFVRVQAQVEFTARDVPLRFLSRIVPMRDGIITLIASKESTELLTEQGKSNLKIGIKDFINELLRAQIVGKVYFTQFVVQ